MCMQVTAVQQADISRRRALDGVKCRLTADIRLQKGPADQQAVCYLTFELVYMLLQRFLLCMQLRLLLYAAPALLCGGSNPDSLHRRQSFSRVASAAE